MNRSTTLPAHLDGLRLRAQLAEAIQTSWETETDKAKAIELIKSYLDQGRDLARGQIKRARGGLEAARTLSDVMNAVLRALFDTIVRDIPGLEDHAHGLVLCALGGYGAGELAPQSDIDLVFLTRDEGASHTQDISHRILYALWDCGLKIGGGSTRNIDDALNLAKTDVSERTALLDIRPVAGDESIHQELISRFEHELVRPHAFEFASAKLSERDARVKRQGDSRYAVEPNVKDGKGGLRDLQTLRWLAQVIYGNDALERWVSDGLLSVDDVDRYLQASDFLWTTRFHLHDIIGHKDDRLTFDIQPEIAKCMGYSDGEAYLAVEAFMHAYFLKTNDVGALTRLVCAKLEADHFKEPPVSNGRFMPGDGQIAPEILHKAGFKLHSGRLDFANPQDIATQPLLMLRLFELAAAYQLDLHPDAVSKVRHNRNLIDDDVRSDPRAARHFFAILLDSDTPRLTLRTMIDTGLLGAYIPEFGSIVARTQFNMYHRFTVDEHTLHALGWLKDIEQGQHTQSHPLLSQLVDQVRNRRALYLAVLLHDTGKGKGDQCIEGAQNAHIVCERFGLDAEEIELVAWLIAHHLDMSDTAQRRDVSDPQTVHEFAQLVRTRERLILLTFLTVVDIRAVGPDVWNGWKGQLLRDLYFATIEVLGEKGETFSQSKSRARLNARAQKARQRFCQAFAQKDLDFAKHWSEDLPSNYWLSFQNSDRLRHGQFVHDAIKGHQTPTIGIKIDTRLSSTEILINTPDRPGLFADIAGALAHQGANIVGAQIYTSKSAQAFDIFYVQDESGAPYGAADPHGLDLLKSALSDAIIKGASNVPLTPVLRREAAFKLVPTVKYIDDATDNTLIIEASGRDRIGLLYALARTLHQHGFAIEGARIEGYGERAVDSFFVTCDQDQPVSEAELAALKSDLLSVLQISENAAIEKRAANKIIGAMSSIRY